MVLIIGFIVLTESTDDEFIKRESQKDLWGFHLVTKWVDNITAFYQDCNLKCG